VQRERGKEKMGVSVISEIPKTPEPVAEWAQDFKLELEF